MRKLSLVGIIAVLSVAIAGSTEAAGICVRAEGMYLPAFLWPDAPNVAERPSVDAAVLKATAERMAEAACNADGGIVSTVTVAAYVDGTAVEIVSPHLDVILKSRKSLVATVKAFAVGVREGDPVVVRLFPLRVGGVKQARVVAIVRPGQEPTFAVCSDPACQAPKPAAK